MCSVNIEVKYTTTIESLEVAEQERERRRYQPAGMSSNKPGTGEKDSRLECIHFISNKLPEASARFQVNRSEWKINENEQLIALFIKSKRS